MTSLSKPIRNGGAYIAYIGSGEHAVRLRLLGQARLEAGSQGLVRLSLPRALPLLPGDRYVLRDSGSSTTVGGGEILDVDPVLQPSRARPDRSVDRVIAERGWVEPVELERLTGTQRDATVGRWVVDPVALADKQNELHGRVQAAGPAGLDIAELDERERATIEADDTIVVSAGRLKPVAAEDPYATHPFLNQLRSALYSPPAPAEAGVSNADVSELVRRCRVIREDGLVFAPEAVAGAAAAASQLLLAAPEGFTVSSLREALGTTRRFTMALVSILDREGMTRRRGDVRIAGPRLLGQAPAR
jgi:selenocysteine-specific elongation factor